MALLLSSFASSIDGFVIGMSFRLQNVNLKKRNLFFIFLTNVFVCSFFILCYQHFHFTFLTKEIITLSYFFFALRSLKSDDTNQYQKQLNFWECIIFAITYSLDGAMISLAFINIYPIWMIVLTFSMMSILFLLFGYLFSSVFKSFKKSNYFSALLFLILALLNQFSP